jgi:hypothetical protein
MIVRVLFCSASEFLSRWKIRWLQLLAFMFCNNIWAKLEIRSFIWNRNTKISREATESELSKLMMVRVAFCSALVFCYLVNKSLKISLECAPPVINFQREERTERNVNLILQCRAMFSSMT